MPARIAMFLAFVVALSGIITFAEDPLPPDEAQIRTWIDELANSQPERNFSGPQDRLTKEERKSLEPVRKAYANLSKHFVASLPYLVESRRDKRFSYPSEHPSSGVFENQSVGNACRSLITEKLLLKSPILLDHRDIAVSYDLPIDKKWYSHVKTMTLFEMQVDSLDWLLAQPPLHGVSKDQWAEEIEAVRRFRDDFARKGKAVDKVLSPTIEGK